MDDIVFDCDTVKSLSEIFKILSEPSRLHILCGLGLECQSVTSIVEDTGLSQTNVSFHLRILREAGLVRPERRGAFIYYCLPDPKLLHLLEAFQQWSETIKKPQNLPAPDKRAG
jgi:ArsR family transcriptional regulator, arsenate/arsenite/antimonite-responsive transcriptional repressor